MSTSTAAPVSAAPVSADASLTPAIHAIGAAVPQTVLRQDNAREIFRSQAGCSPLTRRLIGATFDASAINTRHTVIEEFEGASREEATFVDADGAILSPSTAARNAVYTREAGALGLRAASRALGDLPGLDPSEFTHVVTVSCTGFSAPGLDVDLVRGLGLRPDARRLHVGFLGCYGAFPALHHAVSVCRSEPNAVVLLVCVELCSLHLRVSDDRDAILASSVFADGAAAAVVSARDLASENVASETDAARDAGPAGAAEPAVAGSAPRAPARARLEVATMKSLLTEATSEHMSWTIGDLGFEMVLSSYVPRILEAKIVDALEPLRRARPDLVPGPWADIWWAIHPGGRSILDRVQHALGLDESGLMASRAVLREFGNMSSATVLFILQRLLREAERAPTGRPRTICSAAFGPGLTVESALFVLRSTP